MTLLDGKSLSKKLSIELAEKVSSMSNPPKLVVVQIGDNPASNTYIAGKLRFGKKIGIEVVVYKFEEEINTEAVLEIINFANTDETVGGIIVQLPLPEHIDKQLLLAAISPEKDVDGLGFVSLGKLVKGDLSGKLPATPKGVLTLLKNYSIDVCGKNIVIVGRSQLVGMPLSILLTHMNATVTVVHSHSLNIKEITSQADILIAACGKPNMITKDYIKEGAVIVDVGITKVGEKLFGDVDFESVKDKVSAISPVPGGVGPMTILSLFQNLIGE